MNGACADCGRTDKPIVARGLDNACYVRHQHHDTLDQFPRTSWNVIPADPAPADDGPVAPPYADRGDPDWRHRAACRDEDPELFFPIGTTGPALAEIEEARAVCHRCPVQEACLAWALDTGQDTGVWGGLSEDERRSHKRREARNRARTP